jgi:hypothetical protein
MCIIDSFTISKVKSHNGSIQYTEIEKLSYFNIQHLPYI